MNILAGLHTRKSQPMSLYCITQYHGLTYLSVRGTKLMRNQLCKLAAQSHPWF